MSDPLADEVLEQALSKLKEGRFEDAIDGFNLHLSVNPNEAKAYQGRALANFQIKNWAGALPDFQKAKELNPEDPENWMGLGMCLAFTSEVYPAISVFETLITNHPDFTRGYIQLGQLYYRLGVIKKGHEIMDRALNSRPALEERRLIEKIRNDQTLFDKKRMYRPDFEELNKKNQSSPSLIAILFQSIKKTFSRRK